MPVVLIHAGYQDYVQYSILQACKLNDVFLISNINPNIEDDEGHFHWVDINRYTHGFDEFRQNYAHFNTTPYDFEVFCFHRWFILKNFMKERGFDVALYIDSDVMLYVNAENEWCNFDQFDMTLLHRTAAATSFMTLRGIDNFCNMCEKIYSEKESYDFNKIKSHFDVRQSNGLGGGVCDMTLFEYFHYHAEFGGGPGRVGEMMHIINESVYDHNINVPDQDFRMKNGIKDVQFTNTWPYVYNEKLNKNILFNSFHCQGGAKSVMKELYERSR